MDNRNDKIDISVHNLTKKFGTFTAVQNVSFSVSKGNFFSILGPSGCGKTTLLRMISGFETPDEGDVYIGGEKVNNIPPNRRRTNLVFQHLALFPLKSVYENIAFGLKRRKVTKNEINKRVLQILNKVGLSGFGNKAIHQLSGGQMQRVAIARCLVLDPTVLLLDEPLGALDLKLREHMKIELKNLQERVGTTFIYITHDQGEAMTMSDNIAVMLSGKLEQIGSPYDLFNKPATSFVAAFVGDSNRLLGKILSKAANIVTVQVGSIKVKGIPQPDLFNSNDALVFIRPENIRINPPENSLTKDYQSYNGLVKNAIFEGSKTTYIVEVTENLLIKIFVQQASHISLLSPHDRVNISWKISDTLCFSTKQLKDIDMSVGGEGE